MNIIIQTSLRLAKWIWAKLTYPFSEALLLFVYIFLCLFVPMTIYVTGRGEMHAVFGIFCRCISIAYLVTFLTGLCRPVMPIVRFGAFWAISLYTIVNFFCLFQYGCLADYHILEIIRETNRDELSEFLETYIHTKEILSLICATAVCASVFWTILKVKIRLPRLVACVLTTMVAVCAYNTQVQQIRLAWWGLKLDEVVDLHKHYSNPELTASSRGETLPENVVIIIGESFTPTHSSLYGYDKQTNPRLEQLQRDSSLYVYNNVVSPKTSTAAAFKYILNTYRLGMEEDSRWYEHTTLIEVLQKLGYFTVWHSNQLQVGHGSTVQSTIAKLCNTSDFKEKYTKESKDERMLTHNEPATIGYRAVFYHLIGQHVAFKHRYPKSFRRFTREQYSGTELQRQQYADYDNATHYNDYVVNGIIRKFADRDAIVFYFSDHGLDLFDTDPAFFGHGRKTPESQAAAKRIPFMVWLSPKFKELRPATSRRIAAAKGDGFCTDCLIYSVMDAMGGISFANNDDVARYSIFSSGADDTTTE